MKNIIYRPDGKLTNFAFWTTLLIILAVGYFVLGSFFSALQVGTPDKP
ncbi:MAG: hypothetical protein AAB681_02825 [Patescibacteria group bacterium]